MFTGIIDHYGIISKSEKSFAPAGEQFQRLTITCDFSDLVLGESIAVDGICLTVIDPQTGQFSCDVSPETLKLTTAGSFTVGRKVNLERALRVGDRLGGHWVLGHVDQCGQVVHKIQQQEFTILQIGGFSAETMPFIVKKGSIAVNGVSLTINEVYRDSFAVMLVPHTLMRTNLGQLVTGDNVNLEFDYLIKAIMSQHDNLLSSTR